jgi:hypothetical protein
MLRFAVLIFCLIAAGLAAAALYLPYWYAYTIAGTTIRIGLWETCTNDACTALTFAAADLSECTRTAEDMSNYFYGIIGGGCAAGFFGLLALALSVPASKGAASVRAAFSVLSMIGAMGAVGVFYWFIENYYFCSIDICTLYTNINTSANSADCTKEFGMSFWMMCGAAGATFIAMALAVTVVATIADAEEKEKVAVARNEAVAANGGNADAVVPAADDQPPTAAAKKTDTAAKKTEAAAQKTDAAEPAGKAKAAEPAAVEEDAGADEVEEAGEEEEDDWVWDEESGLYWSDSAYLYLHDESGQFFDPESGQWFDPETGEWYEPDEDDDE